MKKCPFCGSEKHKPYLVIQKVTEPHKFKIYWVQCQCGAKGPHHQIRSMALKLWNGRSAI